MQKIIVIAGPTASGKSALAVMFAKKFNGEIISADSRQVYRGLNIGAGKITKKEMRGIPHYLLDVAAPQKRFTVIQYRRQALIAIKKIRAKNKIPILCGGSGFYIQAVIDGLTIPAVKPDPELRRRLEKLTTAELFQKLKKLDRRRAKNIDSRNRRRLIRALEIIIKTGQPVPVLKREPIFNSLFIGIKKPEAELKKLIKKRLLKRLKAGLIKEVKRLNKNGLSWRRLEEFGLEYRWLAYYLQKKINYEEMIKTLKKEIGQYAKRQMTWFKKDQRVIWINPTRQKEKQKILKIIKRFLS